MDDTVATMVGSPSSKPGKELKLPKKDIEVWNKEILGRVEVKMRQSMNEMRDSERAEEGKELEERERENREFDEGASLLALAQETSWRKTSSIVVGKGDSNTKLLHIIAITNRRRNYIE